MATNDVLEGVDFDYECSKLLKDELRRHGLTYRRLAELLREAGMDETEKSISHKVLRGTFRMSFYLQVLRVLGVNKLVTPVPMSPKYLENSTTIFSDE